VAIVGFGSVSVVFLFAVSVGLSAVAVAFFLGFRRVRVGFGLWFDDGGLGRGGGFQCGAGNKQSSTEEHGAQCQDAANRYQKILIHKKQPPLEGGGCKGRTNSREVFRQRLPRRAQTPTLLLGVLEAPVTCGRSIFSDASSFLSSTA
jgi:hypothetical protein